ncbi:MFS transporter [Brucella intermedia]|uniref:MFS transporter n=1 Tax=Brucella intermedia TaxID=94625 RepID=UPI00224B694E|nr:MFS transporter [Brucella intermedia]
MPEKIQLAGKTEAQTVAPLICLMAIGAGIGVANVYYIQPAIPLVQASFGITAEQASLVPAVSQAGYAAGMLLLAPLGDLVDRKSLILTKSAMLVVALLVSAIAPVLSVLLASSLALGLLGSVGQDFIPLAAQNAPEEQRGRTIGLVTTGLLCGILLSRTVGGVVGDFFGWRAMFGIAAAMVALMAVAVWRRLPRQHSAVAGSYFGMLRSLATLTYRHALLRKALATQALLAATLGAFWSTLALMLIEPPFQLGAGVAGAFGLAGAAGALCAPVFGNFADRRGPLTAIRVGCLLVAGAFALMLLLPHSFAALVVGAVLFDLGVMAGLVSHQTIVTAIDPAARSRLNGLLMTAAMIGMSIGAVAGGWAWSRYGWAGVCLVGVTAGLLALLRSLLPPITHAISKESTS